MGCCLQARLAASRGSEHGLAAIWAQPCSGEQRWQTGSGKTRQGYWLLTCNTVTEEVHLGGAACAGAEAGAGALGIKAACAAEGGSRALRLQSRRFYRHLPLEPAARGGASGFSISRLQQHTMCRPCSLQVELCANCTPAGQVATCSAIHATHFTTAATTSSGRAARAHRCETQVTRRRGRLHML